jgi:tetratricopeptide (TPR) repeat protein
VLSEDESSVDFLQFPNQTLAYRAGDCDDISVLYSALLESVGIRTAFVTAPGHIYMAFALDMEPEEARRVFLDVDDLMFYEDDTWIPVEITLVKDGFLKAWKIGAREWRETNAAGTAAVFPIRQAWESYEPVGFAEQTAAIVLPDPDTVMRGYQSELDRFINQQIQERVAELEAQIQADRDNLRLINRLGVLYARFGLLEEASAQFDQIVRRGEYTAALVNLGNIAYLRGDYRQALSFYRRALEQSPNNSKALLGYARASYAIEDYASVNVALGQLKERDPQAAQRFSYLGSAGSGTGRASQAVDNEISEWDEGE